VLLLDAQSVVLDTLRVLPAVHIVDTRMDLLEKGLDVIEIDSVQKCFLALQNLDEAISQTTPLFVKNYGPSGVSSLGIRGLGANQSMVYWNDIPLSSPNLGMIDIGLLPAGIFDHIAIQNGGGAALFGSGNMSGGLHLSNEPVFLKTHSLQWNGMLGSGHQSRTSLSYLNAGGKWYLKTHFFGKNDRNDFLYYDLHRKERRRENALSKQFSFVQDLAIRWSKKQWMHFGVWVQNAENQIPSSLTSRKNDALQMNDSKRFFAKYYYYGSLFSCKVQSAFLFDKMRYYDPDTIPSLEIDFKMQTLVWQNDVEISTAKNRKIYVFANLFHKYEEANSLFYQSNANRSLLGFRFGVHLFKIFNRWSSGLVVSKHFEKDRIPLLSVNSTYEIHRSVRLKAHFSTNYRLPTFNDLYWIYSGNPDLKPEYSRNLEMGLYLKGGKLWKAALSVYYYAFHDRIVWLPETGIWRPQNISEMYSRGMETHFELNFSKGKLKNKISLNYSFVEAKSGENYMPYVPPHSCNGYWDVNYLDTHFVISTSYQSYYFLNADNSNLLPSVTLVNVLLSRSLHIQKMPLDIQVRVKNILDKKYQIIAFYPMPGRSFELGLRLGMDFI
jgi:iron complex outermembrane receptor protein